MTSKPLPNKTPTEASQSPPISKSQQVEEPTATAKPSAPVTTPVAQNKGFDSLTHKSNINLTFYLIVAPKLPSLDGLNWLLHLYYTRKDFKACKDLIKHQLSQTNGMCEYALYIQG